MSDVKDAKNATDVKTEKKSGKAKAKWVVLLVMVLVLAAGGGVGGFFVWRGMGYLTTDNARVTAPLVAVSPLVMGVLTDFYITNGQNVTAGEVLGRVEYGMDIVAPIDGIVVNVTGINGQVVMPGQPVAVVALTDGIRIEANIAETDISDLYIGQAVTVTVDALGNREFAGRVLDIGRITVAELTGQAMFFNTGGMFTRVTHLLPVQIILEDDVDLSGLLGTNARVRVPLR